MANFNSIPGISAGANPNDIMAMNHGPPHQPLRMDPFDNDMTFDDSMLDPTAALHNLPFTTSYDFENFSSTFEDPFQYSSRQFEPPPAQDASQEDSSPQELDNKLLGFSDTVLHATVMDEAANFSEVKLSAELYGMFFVAESVWGTDSIGRPLELTCYRRNLWQCSGQITVPRVAKSIVNEKGDHIIISELVASITATESIEGKTTEIISIPWKSSTGQAGDEPKVVGAPPNTTLDISTGQEVNANQISVPVSWKRLQFKHATANNGRRKGLQQHYVVKITLLGRTDAGDLAKIAEIQSGPVIVRGRSPRNFDNNKKDASLSSDRKLERKSTSCSDNASLKSEREGSVSTKSIQAFPTLNAQQKNDWAQPYQQLLNTPHPAKRVALSPKSTKPPIPTFSKESASVIKVTGPSPTRNSSSRQGTSLPINLSLSEDERSPNRSSTDGQSPHIGKTSVVVGQYTVSSPTEEDRLLYEYFPLSVDDWLPPVDAVYRPHVVHHTIVPPEYKAQQIRSKAKRYFAPD